MDIIEPIRAAVAATPGNHALRLHLATLLLDAGRAREALDECVHVIGQAPDHAEAFALAARAAHAAGDPKASAYHKTAVLLSGTAAPAPSPPSAPGDGATVTPLLSVVRAPPPDGDIEAERPTSTLADVAGLERVKRRLHTAFLGPLANPALRRAFAKSLRGGLLMYGPPGCGKTFVARALAGELKAMFMSIALTDVLDMYIGESEKNVHRLFENARRSQPCVIFLDEVDALGQKRSNQRGASGRGVVAQLLAELDSFGSDNDGVFVLAATNHPWDVDEALRRPGRFDRTVLVMPPDKPAREAILRSHLRERPVGEVDLSSIAARTRGYSGADLAHVCETATELALEASVAIGEPKPIAQLDLERALQEVKPSTRSWMQTAKNYAQFANEGGIYDELLEP